MPSRCDGLLRYLKAQAAISSLYPSHPTFVSPQLQIAEKKGFIMKAKPTSKTGAISVELGPKEIHNRASRDKVENSFGDINSVIEVAQPRYKPTSVRAA